MDESALPIDIHVNKLLGKVFDRLLSMIIEFFLDWFVSRKHCNKDWSDGLTQIRSQILQALQDMPENREVADILRGNQIHYFTCLEIVEILKKTEADSKNIFGFYSSQRMKDWQEIVKMYQKDNLFLAEIAQIISRNVVHEIPSIKRAISKLENSAVEWNKKSADYLKLSSRLKAEYLAAAEKLGIKGDDVEKELLEQLADFPGLLVEIHDAISTSLDEPVQFYSQFIKAIGSDRKNILPTVKHLIEKGNTTVYEFKRGEKPDSVQHAQNGAKNESASNPAEDSIDFGDDGIDFGDDVPEVKSSSGSGSGSSGSGSGSSGSSGNGFVHVHEKDLRRDSDTNGSAEVIEWEAPSSDKVPSSDDKASSSDDKAPSSDKVPSSDKIARGDEALSVLEFSGTREDVVNEVSEVEAFLSQRLEEVTRREDCSSFLLDQRVIQVSENEEKVSKMLRDVRSVSHLITSERIKVLYMIKDNPKYIQRAVTSLNSRLDMARKAEQKSRLMDHKEDEAMDEIERLKATIPGLVEQTKHLQSLIEEQISRRYKNRRVNLMGVAQVL